MKVNREMIDPQLRRRGYLFDLFMRSRSEGGFLRSMKRARRLTSLLKGRGKKGLKKKEVHLLRKNGSRLRLCIYEPMEKPGRLVPGVLWLHGGGYAQGIPEQSAGTCKRLMDTKPCVILAPDYRLSIDAPYPAALEDAHLTLLYMKDHAKELGIRRDQLMVGGESAGGGLAAALTLYARDRKEVNIAFQMPLYPMIDPSGTTESAKENNAPIWNQKTNSFAWKRYLGDLYGEVLPVYAAPSLARDYSALPPALSFVGDLEPFRDETIAYMENLRNAGVPVSFRLYKGCYHGFDLICPRANISEEATTFFLDGFGYAVDHYTAAQP
ncbi:alpha/beta hydrolase [Proteiniclasticum sp. C24MP]|uniref:alpha/beta hydrolase n=1 Tax=Proteiniclasticum sp. C24MP TaxID=3374101 RepID=UPI0037542AD0